MEIEGDRFRDYFPKRGLGDDVYIGDQYPLCVDLPDRPFLRKGAKFRLLGGSKKPLWLEDDSFIETENIFQHVSLKRRTSDLYERLCNPNWKGNCRYPPVIVLDSNLPCDANGIECKVDTVKTVEVGGVYYGKTNK